MATLTNQTVVITYPSLPVTPYRNALKPHLDHNPDLGAS